jgi:hypothetical protein
VNAIVACSSLKMSPDMLVERFGRVFFDFVMAVEFGLGLQKRGDSAAKNQSDAHYNSGTFFTQ